MLVCRDKIMFVATKLCLSRQSRVCRDKTFVATKMILMAALANDIKQVAVVSAYGMGTKDVLLCIGREMDGWFMMCA